ncbi:hypothetical protein [Brunnivagina elsteri]|nr:hypothetical protein [Calothrix elsteri]
MGEKPNFLSFSGFQDSRYSRFGRNWVSGLSQRFEIMHGGETQFPEFF